MPLYGWNGKILRINLTKKSVKIQEVDRDVLAKFVGGRGLAAWILWNEIKPGTDPLSPDNKLVFMAGPLTGLPLPSSGKIVVASKSPLTHGYGDGNVGTKFSVSLRKAGYDGIVIEGKAKKPVYIFIENEKVEIKSAEHLWGLDTFETEDKLESETGKGFGIVEIGPAGENLVKYAVVMSEKGRAGGRPGMGAVMGSKNLKAIVVHGDKEIPLFDKESLVKKGAEGYSKIKQSDAYDFWMRQGTTGVLRWCQEASVLPTYNFREGVFDEYEGITGEALEKLKQFTKGCPNCNMICGHNVRFKVDEGEFITELDYENVAMLGSNIGIGDLNKVSYLNLLADKFGVDTISVGSAIGFAMELSEKGIIKDKIEWGDYKKAAELIKDITYKKTKLGKMLAEGIEFTAKKLGKGSESFAMHVKGLPISAYDCHAAPGMALAYGTSPIGAHHKDAWIIMREIKQYERHAYNKEKVETLVWLQNLRGGLFETLTTCRLPWIEVGYPYEEYYDLFYFATGMKISYEFIQELTNRIYSLIRAFWVREYKAEGKKWLRGYDIPPARWFKEPLTKGPEKGAKLDYDNYNKMLSWYYELRGWNENGIPTKETLEKLGLPEVADVLWK
ncbi:MAG: aldehyde ferredoxin oxidoreductase family protein [Crenarchaeota archaeon]|nr:aldehyde ferredoxin oxidoreductase family protein [Thermoproteota archaeon]MCR8455480.1 aldehyde ferredoxin oxidoreductase family protein [Thermoproteota archaeon]MCR8501524.1 aldehyde ferredoxin oxidoreductase family protein [Thermoproteota archaeon]